MKGLNSFFDIYKTSYYLLFVIIFSSILLLFDNDPPPFPPDPRITPVDSFSINLLNFSQNGSYLTFYFSTLPFVQYPQSTALQLIRIVINAGSMIQDIPYTKFLNISHTNDGYDFSFTVQSQISSNQVKVIVYSQLHNLGEITTFIPNQENPPEGYSSVATADHYTIQYENACYLNETIVFSAYSPSKFEPLYVSHNISIPISTPLVPFETIAIGSSNEIDSYPIIFISEQPKSAFEQLIYVLLPLYGVTFVNLHEVHHKVILTRNQSWLIPNIQKLIYDPIFPQNTDTCFVEGIFLRSPTVVPVGLVEPDVNYTTKDILEDYLEWIMNFLPEIIPYFKQHFTNKTTIKKNKIVLDNNVKAMANKIKRFLPDAEITILDDNVEDISIIADTLGDAELFISSHISTFAFALFLPENSTLLEFQPDGLYCTTYGEFFAKMANAKYNSFFKSLSGQCDCPNITCFFKDQLLYNQMSEKNLKKIILKSLG